MYNNLKGIERGIKAVCNALIEGKVIKPIDEIQKVPVESKQSEKEEKDQAVDSGDTQGEPTGTMVKIECKYWFFIMCEGYV